MSETDPTEDSTSQRPKARELNDTIRYTMWSVFQLTERPSSNGPRRDAERAGNCC